jgi:hypothetical protein
MSDQSLECIKSLLPERSSLGTLYATAVPAPSQAFDAAYHAGEFFRSAPAIEDRWWPSLVCANEKLPAQKGGRPLQNLSPLSQSETVL